MTKQARITVRWVATIRTTRRMEMFRDYSRRACDAESSSRGLLKKGISLSSTATTQLTMEGRFFESSTSFYLSLDRFERSLIAVRLSDIHQPNTTLERRVGRSIDQSVFPFESFGCC